MKKQVKFGVGIGVIVASMGFLAWLGYGESKTYYHTIAELPTLTGAAKGNACASAAPSHPEAFTASTAGLILCWKAKVRRFRSVTLAATHCRILL